MPRLQNLAEIAVPLDDLFSIREVDYHVLDFPVAVKPLLKLLVRKLDTGMNSSNRLVYPVRVNRLV